MTWNSRDAMPPVRRDKTAQAPPWQPGETSATPMPEKIPTYTQQALYLLANEEEGLARLTPEQERMLAADGIWPEREWSIWKHAMTRGIQAY